VGLANRNAASQSTQVNPTLLGYDFLVGAIGRLRLVAKSWINTKHTMQYEMDEQNDMIWWWSKTKTKVSLN
jgi:hypothetical protein